jgi:Ser/Thr protein kinase RdoA (MazF antagonist)
MTKQGSFKRAVRRRARESGQRYSQARAAMEGKVPPPNDRRVEHPALKAHLEQRYGISITSMTGIAFPSWRERPCTLLVKRKDGPPWVARVFSSPADTVDRVESDAEILRFLASHDFPAERLAHAEPVSVLDGSGVIVTEFVNGHPTADGRLESAAVTYELATLLGRLHSLPAARGAVARDGGSYEHDGGYYLGRPKQDLASAMNALVSVEEAVAPEGRETFERLRDLVENADDAEGLPEALTHGNYHAWAAVGKPGDIVIVGWAGAGRGPRLAALGWLLKTSSEAGTDHVDAAVRGYREHVQLTDAELDRLPGVLDMKPLYLMCHDYRTAVLNGHTPGMDESSWIGSRERGEQLAAQLIAAFRA